MPLILIPEAILGSLEECRDAGEFNMMDRTGVCFWLIMNQHTEEADWIDDYVRRSDYTNLLEALSEYKGQSKQ